MAEFGAHLAAPTVDFPSIFEVLAQEKLFQSLQPAITYLCNKLILRRYNDRSAALQNCNNIFTSLNLVVQHYYLKYYGASFAEHFYGLKRIAIQEPKLKSSEYKLPWDIHIRSLITLVLLPHLKEEINQLYEKRKDENRDTNQTEWLQKLWQTFIYVYPFIHLCWDGLILLYQLAYTFKKSKYHSPLQHLSGTQLCILNENDLIESQIQSFQFDSLRTKSFKQMIPKLIQAFGKSIFIVLSTGFSIGAFFLQFLEWWQTTDHLSSNLIAKDSIPIAPQQYPMKDNIPIQLCPVCLEKRKNETALATSGFVFCYSCIHHFLVKHRKCPVTGYPSSHQHLIKIHQPGS